MNPRSVLADSRFQDRGTWGFTISPGSIKRAEQAFCSIHEYGHWQLMCHPCVTLGVSERRFEQMREREGDAADNVIAEPHRNAVRREGVNTPTRISEPIGVRTGMWEAVSKNLLALLRNLLPFSYLFMDLMMVCSAKVFGGRGCATKGSDSSAPGRPGSCVAARDRSGMTGCRRHQRARPISQTQPPLRLEPPLLVHPRSFGRCPRRTGSDPAGTRCRRC